MDDVKIWKFTDGYIRLSRSNIVFKDKTYQETDRKKTSDGTLIYLKGWGWINISWLQMFNKQDFKKEFPDVCVQEITFDNVLSRSVIENKVMALVAGLDTGLITCESYGKNLKVFTSDKLKNELDRMIKGYQVIDKNFGRTGTITSDQPFICGCEMCVRVDFGKSSDVYACTYFL